MNQDLEKYPMVHCRECGKDDQATYMEPTKSEMVEQQLCFACNFWRKWVERKDDPRVVRAGGGHFYYFDRNSGMQWWKGFVGEEWRIRFSDGRLVETNELWAQGTIPEHFRERLPDNAKLASRVEDEWYGEGK